MILSIFPAEWLLGDICERSRSSIMMRDLRGGVHVAAANWRSVRQEAIPPENQRKNMDEQVLSTTLLELAIAHLL